MNAGGTLRAPPSAPKQVTRVELRCGGGNAIYTAIQLRRRSESEPSELVADGFDLSISDETGQTAFMLAAFPPFSRDQFEKLTPWVRMSPPQTMRVVRP